MREFFRGWRRKIGVVTLGLACLIVREYFVDWQQLEKDVRSKRFALILRAQLAHEQNRTISVDGDEVRIAIEDYYNRFSCLPYLYVAAPLILLSAYLLLRKPRRLVPKSTDLTPTTGP